MNRIHFKNLTTSLIRDRFLRHNLVFFTGSMIVAVLNYAYHPVLSRFLSVEDFGEVQTILSLIMQSSILLSAINVVALAMFADAEKNNSHRTLIADLQSFSVYLLVGIAGALFLARNALTESMSFHSPLPFILLAGILLVTVAQSMRRSYLQYRHDFKTLSLSSIVIAGGKLILAVLFVLIGMRSFGAILAFLIASILSLLYVQKKTGTMPHLSWKFVPRISPALIAFIPYGILTLVALGFVTILYNTGITVAKYAFDPTTAGLYSGVSVVASIVFFASSSVASVLLASVRQNQSTEENAAVLKKGVLLTILTGGTFLILFSLLPATATKILLGSQYIPLAYLLPRLSCIAFLASLLNVYFFYLLALRSYRLAYAVITGTAALVLALIAMPLTPATLTNAFLIAAAASVATLPFCVYKRKDKKN